MTTKQFNEYKAWINKEAAQDLKNLKSEGTDPKFIRQQAKSFRNMRRAASWQDLFDNMGDAGWARPDMGYHAEEFDQEGRSDIADALREAVAAGFADNMDS